MIEFVTGNLLEADTEALVNAVNSVGVMGKGIALQFKRAFPANYLAYEQACRRAEVKPGTMFLFKTDLRHYPKYIINFPTKRHWRDKSRLEDIELGLKDLVKVIRDHAITSLALPALGCGNGGLAWHDVRPLLEAAFYQLSDVRLVVYVPGSQPSP